MPVGETRVALHPFEADMTLVNAKPQFYFQVDPMRDASRFPRLECNEWAPPRRLGANRLVSDADSQVFYHDGFATVRRPLPDHLRQQSYMCYSLYADEHAGIRLVPYDASSHQVNDGVDHDAHDSSDESGASTPDSLPLRPDWRHLSFDSLPNNHRQISSAVHNGRFTHLLAYHRLQEWVPQLIPERYIGPDPVRSDSGQGGLVGDIALLLGLLALSVPFQQMYALLPALVQEHWQVLPAAAFPGREARQSNLGVFPTGLHEHDLADGRCRSTEARRASHRLARLASDHAGDGAGRAGSAT